MTLAMILAAIAMQPAPADDRRQLAADLQAEAREYRATLPNRDGPLTISAVDVVGTAITYTGTVAADMDDASVAAFRQALVQALCGADNASTRSAILRGASFTYDLRDTGGERFVTTVNRCD